MKSCTMENVVARAKPLHISQESKLDLVFRAQKIDKYYLKLVVSEMGLTSEKVVDCIYWSKGDHIVAEEYASSVWLYARQRISYCAYSIRRKDIPRVYLSVKYGYIMANSRGDLIGRLRGRSDGTCRLHPFEDIQTGNRTTVKK